MEGSEAGNEMNKEVVKPPPPGINEKRLELEARLIRMSLLAKPHAARLLPSPDPNLYFIGGKPISQSALIYRPSKRILLLSKVSPRHFTQKFSKPEIPKHCVNPEALVFQPSQRILELATYMKKEVHKKVKKDKKKLRRMRRFLQNRPAWLELRAGPKAVPKPPPLEKIKPSKPMTPGERDERIQVLAVPKFKYKPPAQKPEISKAALKYVPSKRILEISGPKELAPQTVLDITFNPFKIKKSALTYKATERIIQLAIPNIRKKQEDTDVKENPFSVLPRALTAICTKRVKELAKPVDRD